MSLCLFAMQALQLVADVHSLADQVRSKCAYKEAERTASGALTPRFHPIRENDNQVCLNASCRLPYKAACYKCTVVRSYGRRRVISLPERWAYAGILAP